jgi:hypothetical protein
MPVVPKRPLRAASSHDQAARNAGDHAVSVGASRRGAVKAKMQYTLLNSLSCMECRPPGPAHEKRPRSVAHTCRHLWRHWSLPIKLTGSGAVSPPTRGQAVSLLAAEQWLERTSSYGVTGNVTVALPVTARNVSRNLTVALLKEFVAIVAAASLERQVGPARGTIRTNTKANRER